MKAETLVEDASPAADLKVRDLSFGVVSGVSFEGKVGQVIGVTGPVASGKSSIGSALQGLWPYGGSITINGRELGSMSQKEISRFVTYMGHDAQLLSDTIYRNLTMGEDGDVTAVLDDVCFGPDLETMDPEHPDDALQEQILDRIGSYVDMVCQLYRDDIKLHGDGFFFMLDDWFAQLDLGPDGVRSGKVIKEDVVSSLDYPAFAMLSDKGRLEQYKRRLQGLAED